MIGDLGEAAASLLRQLTAILAGSPAVSEPGAWPPAIMEIAPGGGPRWGTLSGLTAHPADPTRLYAITDQDSPPLRIVEIAVGAATAEVVRQIEISTPGLSGLDTEGLVVKPDGGFWLASEGGKGNHPPNRLIEVDAAGRLLRTLELPDTVAKRMTKSGFEGVALWQPGGRDELVVALQGAIHGDDKHLTRIAAVDPATGAWSFFHYPLDSDKDGEPTGLSEILHIGHGRFAAIERDGKGGKHAIKWITTFALPAERMPEGASLPLLRKTTAVDMVPRFLDAARKVEKEIEGLALSADGQLYVSTDNDNDRPTLLIRVGAARALLQ